MEDKVITVPITVMLGYNKVVFIPLAHKNIENSIGLFEKNSGKFNDVYLEDLPKVIEESKPLVAIQFKSKKSINTFIKWLRFYRDNIYKKEQQNER